MNDSMMRFLATRGYPTGALDDRIKEYLMDQLPGSEHSDPVNTLWIILGQVYGYGTEIQQIQKNWAIANGATSTLTWNDAMGTLQAQALGPELVTQDFAGWNFSSATGSNGVITATNGLNFAYRNLLLTNGVTYRISFDAAVTSGNELRINTFAPGTVEAGLINWSVTESGHFTGTFVSTGAFLSIEARNATFTGVITNLSVRAVI